MSITTAPVSLRSETVQFETTRFYSNSLGILGSYQYSYGQYSGQIANNLVYANTNQGININGGGGAQVLNNTVYQSVGDALLINNNSIGIFVRNNILQVDAGYAINVAQNSQTGFNSDYNLIYTTSTGKLGIGDRTSTSTEAIGSSN